MKHVLRVLFDRISPRSRKAYLAIAGIALFAFSLSGSASAQFGYLCQGNSNCPCSNPPTNPGAGCNNFGQHTGGALLTPAGNPTVTPSTDTLQFTATAENNTSFSILIQGTVEINPPFVFGAGQRCVGGTLKRMYQGNASAGVFVHPSIFEPDVATRSANPPGPLDPLNPGDSRYYFVYYRDPMAAGPCGVPASTYNSTEAVRVYWQL